MRETVKRKTKEYIFSKCGVCSEGNEQVNRDVEKGVGWYWGGWTYLDRVHLEIRPSL